MKRKLFIPLFAVLLALSLSACDIFDLLDQSKNSLQSSEASQVTSSDSSGISDSASQETQSPQNSQDAQTSQDQQSSPTVSQNSSLTAEQAKEIALNHAGVKADGTAVKTDYDFDDGIPSYEIEFWSGGIEYDYDIHAQTGEILKAEKDHKNILTSSGTSLKTEAEAKQIALNNAGLKEENISGYRIELDRDNGISVYEIEFRSAGYEYEYEINAQTGDIIKSQKEFD